LKKINEENKSKLSEIEIKYKKIIEEKNEKIKENKILKQKFDKMIKRKDMTDIQIKFNNGKVFQKDLKEEEEKNKLNYIRKKKLFNNLSKSVILKESSEILKIDNKIMDKIDKDEDFYKNNFIEKYKQSKANGTNKASKTFLRKQSIKENEEKISNLKNEIEKFKQKEFRIEK